jgi:hypothetical protein
MMHRQRYKSLFGSVGASLAMQKCICESNDIEEHQQLLFLLASGRLCKVQLNLL